MNKFTNSFEFNEHRYYYCDLKKVFETYPILKKLPNSLKVLLEANIRNAKENELNGIINAFVIKNNLKQIEFYPSRVIMKDFAGIPAIVDLASMRDALAKRSGNVQRVNPQIMVDLVIEQTSNTNSTEINLQKEIVRNKERYQFAKWAQNQFKNFSIIPPSSHSYSQINLEYLSTMISAKNIEGKTYIYPETIVGTDSHTTMINSLGILGLSVGGIEVESAMLGSSISLNLPKVVGVEVVGSFAQGVSYSDAVLNLSNILKEYNVAGKLVEFYGVGLRNISLEDRATISNMSPEYEALCSYFGIDENTISFIEKTRGVDASLIKEYYKRQNMYDVDTLIEYDEYVKFDLSQIRPVVSGPKRVQDKVVVEHIPSKIESYRVGNFVKDNDIVQAKITSSTSNITLLIQAGLLAKRACELGLQINKNIMSSLVADSLVFKGYLEKLDLLRYFEQLGFYNLDSKDNKTENLVESVSMDIEKFNLNVSSLTSDEKNFEEKNYSLVKSNWLMSPSLIIAYCLKGNMDFDIIKEPISRDIYLSDIWPSIVEVNEYLEKIDNTVFGDIYKDAFLGNKSWQDLQYEDTLTYKWNEKSTYIQASEFFDEVDLESIDIENAKILALLGDSVTSEHLSPVGQIPPYSPASLYLESKGLKPDEFNSFESRYGNGQLMVRGTLSNIRLKNKMVAPKEGGYTKDFTSGELLPLYDFSLKMQNQGRHLVIFAGNEYGIGTSRDWASKGVKLLGVKAIIAKSFEIKHKSDLVGMGILPLEFIDDDIESLSLKGDETITIKSSNIKANTKIDIEIKKADEVRVITVQSRLDTNMEVEYYRNGGVLSYLLKNIS